MSQLVMPGASPSGRPPRPSIGQPAAGVGAGSGPTMAHESGTPTLGSRRGFQESPAHHQARQRINLAWLMRLRWGAALGQLTAILTTHWGWGVPLPMMPLMLACSATLASNLWVAWYVRRVNAAVSDAFVGRIVALDICSLTLLLYFTGGPHNPFHFLYLVHMALAAMTLNTRWLSAIVGSNFISNKPPCKQANSI